MIDMVVKLSMLTDMNSTVNVVATLLNLDLLQ